MVTLVAENSKSVGNDRMVLIAVADESNDEGVSGFTSTRVSKKTGIPLDGVHASIASLVSSGELLVSEDGAYRIVVDGNVSPFHLDAPVVPDARPESEKAFEMFWRAYPRKIAKSVARSAFIRGECHLILEKILAAIVVQRKSEQWSRDSGAYIPHPATWLNQKRYEDELTPRRPKGPNI